MSAVNMKRMIADLEEVEKKVLLAFASADWRSARHLRDTVDVLGRRIGSTCKTLSLDIVRANSTDDILNDALSEVAAYELQGYLRVLSD